MTQVEKSKVTIIATEPTELEPGVILHAGAYDGIRTQLGIPMMGQTKWTNPEYKIELSAAQLKQMGLQQSQSLISVEFDVTSAVNSGQLKVS